VTRSEAHTMLLSAFEYLGLHYADCASFRSRGMYLPYQQYALEILKQAAAVFEPQRVRLMAAEGHHDSLSNDAMIAKLEHMRNQVLVAATMSERSHD